MAKAAEYVKVNGKAFLAVEDLLAVVGKKKIEDAYGEEVTLVITGPIAGRNEKPTKSSGLQLEVIVTTQGALVLNKAEASDFVEKIGEKRAKEYEERTGQAPLDLDAARKAQKTAKGQARGGKDSRDKD